MLKTFEQWRHVADYNILHRTTDDPVARAELLDKVAAKCVEMEANGEIASIWHSSSMVQGHKCRCAQCEP